MLAAGSPPSPAVSIESVAYRLGSSGRRRSMVHTVDISAYSQGIFVVPSGRTARVVDENGRLIAVSNTEISDDDVLGLLEAIRR